MSDSGTSAKKDNSGSSPQLASSTSPYDRTAASASAAGTSSANSPPATPNTSKNLGWLQPPPTLQKTLMIVHLDMHTREA
ncbi:hypothetical protein DL769_002701 [Monosporascus sp. CRB-8-3]|nr:hypothetical protein DL769_002701 [Monosporascus sp. CRB-8-3]